MCDLKIGDRIRVRVERIEEYAIFVSHDGIPGLIQVTDIDWVPCEPRDRFGVGDIIEAVVVMTFFEEDRKEKFRVSVKELTPSPFLPVRNMEAGTHLKGEVSAIADYGVFISISEGVEALLPSYEIKEKLTLGMRIIVRIEETDPELEKVRVSFVESLS